MPVKMIVTDLDSTLLRADKSISSYAAEVLRQCKAQGIKVTFATARSEKSSERFISAVSPDIIISNGGAMARCSGETLYQCSLTSETAHDLILRCLQTPGTGYITADTEKGYFVNHPLDIIYPGWLDYRHAVYTDFSIALECGVYKITVQLPDEQTACKIAGMFPDVDVITFSGEGWYRFAHKKATKWEAVKAVSERLGISVQDIAAFGDDYNDVEMLKKCGIGVAVDNAIDEAKAAAGYTCDSNDKDGVVKWIAANVL